MLEPVENSPPEDLSQLIAEIDCLRLEFGCKLVDLRFWADNWVHPSQLDGDGLELLLERLCVRWADG